MNTSGTQSSAGLAHGASCDATSGSAPLMIAASTQCASGAHGVSDAGSITAGQPASYSQVAGSSQTPGGGGGGSSPTQVASVSRSQAPVGIMSIGLMHGT